LKTFRHSGVYKKDKHVHKCASPRIMTTTHHYPVGDAKAKEITHSL